MQGRKDGGDGSKAERIKGENGVKVLDCFGAAI
jgi:hypothetical protein